MNQINLDTYSLKINRTNTNIKIKPLIDVIGGKEIENYAQKTCYITINSVNENVPVVTIENKEGSFFYFKDYNNLTISYQFIRMYTSDFAALFFQFNENSNFSVNITCRNKNLIYKNFYNSNYLYLHNDIFAKVSNYYRINNLNIYIEKYDSNKSINFFFKVVEDAMISLLQKNSLNYGFSTTSTQYQFYYFEVFKGKEGEINLHHKRFNSQLVAKIVTKDEINYSDLFNYSIYFKYPNDKKLNYNLHSLKLKYTYKDTLICDKGCYILIVYYFNNCILDYIDIGYEFTLLSRSWISSNFMPEIIDIPFNEYILGSFEKGSLNTHHYYCIDVPNNAEKIVIQFEGNFIEGFYEQGRKRINTMEEGETNKNLNIIGKQNVITLNISELNMTDKKISFAFRSKDFFDDIFSFYYFRILYFTENELKYFSLDSQLGNLCIPKYNEETKFFNCYFMFDNNKNELLTDFSISTTNQNEYYKIYITKEYINGTVVNETKEIFYNHHNETDDIANFYFIFEFNNSEIKSIISSLYEGMQLYFLNIYSSQMFYIKDNETQYFFRLEKNYTLIYNYIYGSYVNINYMYFNYQDIEEMPFIITEKNSRGKPVSIDLHFHDVGSIILLILDNIEWLFTFQLEYNMRNKGIIELKSGETRNQIMETGYFPLYYYLKIKNNDYINIDINLGLKYLNSTLWTTNFEINGYIFDEDTIKRKINGEYINLEKPIKGNYSNKYNVGLLQINQEKKYNDSNYLLIEIMNKDSLNINSSILIEFIIKENHEEIYFMPINQYIIESFDGNNDTIRYNNDYHIFVNQRAKYTVIIEFSPEYNDIDLIFSNKTKSSFYFDYTIKYETGFKKYIINKIDNNNNIYFSIINPKKRKANYMIRYLYGDNSIGDNLLYATFLLNTNYYKQYIYTNEEKITLSLTFDQIQGFYNNKPGELKRPLDYYISGLLYKQKNYSEELLNTTSLLNERAPLYENQIININYPNMTGKFTLIFENIPRNDNYIYDLQIQAFIRPYYDMTYFEEFLVFNTEVNLTDIKIDVSKF